MDAVYPDQFLGLPPCLPEEADAVILPLPVEKTASYGAGTWRAPRAIIEASCQLETFDEESLVDFSVAPRVHTSTPPPTSDTLLGCLDTIKDRSAKLRGKFLVGLGGEHSVTFGMACGLTDNLAELTVVQVDAHADLIDELDGNRWSHGTVMKRLWDEGCHIIQVGIRSLSRLEYDLVLSGERIATCFAHQLAEKWQDLLATLEALRGPVYLTIDVDGLDPSVIPSTGAPQPGGLTWDQTMQLIRAVTSAPEARLIGADIVEYVASPHPPGCDIIAAKLLLKVLACRLRGRQADGGSH